MEASTENGAHDRSDGIELCGRGRSGEVREGKQRAVHGGRHQAEGRKMRDNELAFWREADMEKSGTPRKRQVDDERKGGPCELKSGGGWVTHDNKRKVVLEDDKTGKGPPWLNTKRLRRARLYKRC
jgi:hypothetical protein